MIAIAPMTPEHADDVLRIYKHGIDEGAATFETAVPTWVASDAAKLPEHRFVGLDDGTAGRADLADSTARTQDGTTGVLGYGVASAVSKRPCYAGVVDLSIYVAP